jgi:hypothetical protein
MESLHSANFDPFQQQTQLKEPPTPQVKPTWPS